MQKPIDLHEIIIDQIDLELDNFRMYDSYLVEHDKELRVTCSIIENLGSFVLALSEQMDNLEPDYRNYTFLRLPIDV